MKADKTKKLSEVLRAYRLSSGMTQQAVADALGLSSKRNVIAWEKGEYVPNAESFLAMLELYGISDVSAFLDNPTAAALSPEALRLVKAYEEAPEGMRAAVDKLLDL